MAYPNFTIETIHYTYYSNTQTNVRNNCSFYFRLTANIPLFFCFVIGLATKKNVYRKARTANTPLIE
jgi:hypothetical protein